VEQNKKGKEPLEPHQSPEDLPNVNYQVDEEEVEEEIIPQPGSKCLSLKFL